MTGAAKRPMDRAERRLRTDLARCAGYRDRLELALPARMLWQCSMSVAVHPDATDGEREFFATVGPLLQRACCEPFEGLPPGQWNEATALCSGLCRWLLAEYGRRPVVTVFMIVLRWLEALLDADALVLYQGSACDAALARILAELAEAGDVVAAVDGSASKGARRLHAKLVGLGLYRDAVLAPGAG